MKSLRIFFSFKALLGILLSAAGLPGQFETAEALGTVRDASGARCRRLLLRLLTRIPASP
jgi:hypothetical protein